MVCRHQTVLFRQLTRRREGSRQQLTSSPLLGPISSLDSTNRQPEIQHQSPLRCACVGAVHDSGCRFFHPHDLDQHDPVPAVPRKCQSRPHYAMSTPSASSYSQPSSAAHSPRPYSELEGSPGANSCLCTGGLHERECRFYPGLPLPTFSSLSIAESLSSSLQHSPTAAYGVTAIAPGEPMRVTTSDVEGGFVPQRPGQQAELAASQSPTDQSWRESALRPEPLRPRADERSARATGSRTTNET